MAKGWHSRGYLPHLDSSEVTQHVTFRLADSLPSSFEEPDEHALDRGHGSAFLATPEVAAVIITALHHFDGSRYQLKAWCIMPNHVHALIWIAPGSSLGKIVGSWKSYTARRINSLRNTTGAVWAKDYYDRYMRNDDQYLTTKRYIEFNPVNAGLCDAPEDWAFSSAARA